MQPRKRERLKNKGERERERGWKISMENRGKERTHREYAKIKIKRETREIKREGRRPVAGSLLHLLLPP